MNRPIPPLGRRTVAFAATLPAALLAVQPLSAQRVPPEQVRAAVEEGAVASMRLFQEYLALPNDAHFPEDMEHVAEEIDTRVFR